MTLYFLFRLRQLIRSSPQNPHNTIPTAFLPLLLTNPDLPVQHFHFLHRPIPYTTNPPIQTIDPPKTRIRHLPTRPCSAKPCGCLTADISLSGNFHSLTVLSWSATLLSVPLLTTLISPNTLNEGL